MAARSPSIEASWNNANWYGSGWGVSSDNTTAGQWYVGDTSTNSSSAFGYIAEGIQSVAEGSQNVAEGSSSSNSYQSWGSTKATWGMCFITVLIPY